MRGGAGFWCSPLMRRTERMNGPPGCWCPFLREQRLGWHVHHGQLSPELEEAAAQGQQEIAAAIEAEERELEQMRMEGEQEELAA